MAPVNNVLSTPRSPWGTEWGYPSSGLFSPRTKTPGFQKWILRGITFLRARSTCTTSFSMMVPNEHEVLLWRTAVAYLISPRQLLLPSNSPSILEWTNLVKAQTSHYSCPQIKVFSSFSFVFWYRYRSSHRFPQFHRNHQSLLCHILPQICLIFLLLGCLQATSYCHLPSLFLVNSDSSYTFKKSLLKFFHVPLPQNTFFFS